MFHRLLCLIDLLAGWRNLADDIRFRRGKGKRRCADDVALDYFDR
jgi:hypothetical protein